MIRIIAAFCFLIVLSGYSRLMENNRSTKKRDIRTALNMLLGRQKDDAFVIIEDRKSKKFVQFAGGAGQGLHFDLPSQPLSLEEMNRAKVVLAEYGIQMEEWEVYDRPGGKVVGMQRGFQADLGLDLDQAVEIVWRVLMDVYRFDQDFPMGIEEN
jgi:hypothetical protein